MSAASSLAPNAHLTRRARKRRAVRRQRLVIGVVAVVGPFAAVGLYLPARHEVIRGVRVGGVDVGGLTRAQAEDRLASTLPELLSRPVRVRTVAGTATVVPARLGIRIDLPTTVARAYGRDRLLGRLLPGLRSTDVDPALHHPAVVRLPRALRRVPSPPVSALPEVRDDGTVRVRPGRPGVDYAPAATYAAIAAAALRGEDSVTIRPEPMEPPVTTAMAAETVEQARTLLSAPVALQDRGRPVGSVTPAELAPLLGVRRTARRYRIAVDPAGLRRVLRRELAGVGRPAQNARWSTDGRRATVVRSQPGLGLDARRTALAVVDAGLSPGRRASVQLAPTAPDLTTAEADRLGIREKVAMATTEMGTSSPGRVHNVHLMADIIDGHVIPPGETFSFNDTVGERTVERGFREGQAIADGLLIPSIGGGVCQVATTLFDGAFLGGYPVSERVNHSFHIAHYGLGMDAAVSWGGPDLVFTNDSPYAILIRMSYTDATLTTGFYSTSRGLTVEQRAGEPTDFREPGIRYLLDPALIEAESVPQTRGQRGFDVTVHRVVRRGDDVLREDSFRSSYDPEDAVTHVGPAFKAPKNARVEPLPATGT